MNIILLENIRNLGNIGDQVRVRGGYGRNYLIPQGKAVFATPQAIEQFEARRAELEKKAAEAAAAAGERAALLEGRTFVITQNASDEGRLFGSVTTREIADAMVAEGLEVNRQDLSLPEGAIRHVGEYPVSVHLYADVDASVTVQVVAS